MGNEMMQKRKFSGDKIDFCLKLLRRLGIQKYIRIMSFQIILCVDALNVFCIEARKKCL